MKTSNRAEWQVGFWPWCSLLLLAGVVRGLVLVAGWTSLQADPDAYGRLAVNWSTTGVYGFESAVEGAVEPTAYRPPAYPWLLSFLVRDGQLALGGVAVLHWLLGCASVGLTYAIGRRLQVRGAWWAALAVALDPLLLRASQLVMTETLATGMALLLWWLWLLVWPVRPGVDRADGADPGPDARVAAPDMSWQRWTAAVAFGLCFGLAILARPTAAPWAALCLAAIGFQRVDRWRQRLCIGLLIVVGMAVCLIPWIARNQRTFGQPMWATTHGGYTFLLANNPLLFEHFARRGPSRDWDAAAFHAAWGARDDQPVARLLESQYWLDYAPQPDAAVAPIEEIDDDRLAYAIAKRTIADHPAVFLLSCVYRVGWLWAAWPHDAPVRLVSILIGVWYLTWYVLAVRGGWSVWRRATVWRWLPGWLLILSLTLVHAVYWSNMRMRGPVMPVVYLLAAAVPLRRVYATSPSDARES